MALSAALHHSRGVGPVLHEAPRGPKMDRAVEEEVREVNDALEGQKRPPPGVRPAPLSEVAGPQAAVTVGYVAAGVPLLGAPSMASPSAEAIDESTLSFLLGENLARVKEKEEVEELVADLDRMEQKLLVELVRYRASFKRGDMVLSSRFMAKTALADSVTTASPWRYTNTGPAGPQQLDPGGASVSGH